MTAAELDRKRRRKTENIKFFSKPFRTDKYQSHLEGEHRTKWEEYKRLPLGDKATFFDYQPPRNVIIYGTYKPSSSKASTTIIPVTTTTPITGTNIYYDTSTSPLVSNEDQNQTIRFLIKSSIMNNIMKAIVHNNSEKDDDFFLESACLIDDSCSEHVITNVQQLELVIMHLANGLSFQQVIQSIKDTNQILGLDQMNTMKTTEPPVTITSTTKEKENGKHNGGEAVEGGTGLNSSVAEAKHKNINSASDKATQATATSSTKKTTSQSTTFTTFQMGNISDQMIRRYAFTICANNYQQLSKLLQDCCWGFSLHLNVYHLLSSKPFVDVRVVVFVRENIHSFHVCALPLFCVDEVVSAKRLYDTYATCMDTIEPKWRLKVIGIQSSINKHGAVNEGDLSSLNKRHIQKVNAFEALVAKQCMPSFHREWCGVSALEEYVFHPFYCGILASDPEDRDTKSGNKLFGKWYKDFISISTYLSQETDLCNSLGSPFPCLHQSEPATTGAPSVTLFSSSNKNTPISIRWINSKKVLLRDHFTKAVQSTENVSSKRKQQNKELRFGDAFWAVLALADDVAELSIATFKSLLQSDAISHLNKIQTLEILMQNLMKKFKVEEVHPATAPSYGGDDVKRKKYQLRSSKLSQYWDEQGTFTKSLIQAQGQQEYWQSISIELGQRILNMIERLHELIEYYKTTATSHDFVGISAHGTKDTSDCILFETPCQPTKIVNMSGTVFLNLVKKYASKLESIDKGNESNTFIIDALQQEFKNLREAYRSQPRVKALLQEVETNDISLFSQSWRPIYSDSLAQLYTFFGTVATKLISPYQIPGSTNPECFDQSMFYWTTTTATTTNLHKKIDPDLGRCDNVELVTNFELESKFHAQQWKELCQVTIIDLKDTAATAPLVKEVPINNTFDSSAVEEDVDQTAIV